jgi:hypothetical protein
MIPIVSLINIVIILLMSARHLFLRDQPAVVTGSAPLDTAWTVFVVTKLALVFAESVFL